MGHRSRPVAPLHDHRHRAVSTRRPTASRLEAKVDRGTRDIARLRQRAVTPPWRVAPPRWVVDPNFDMRYHVRWTNAVGDGSLRALLDFAAPIAMQSFDRARPLWEFTVVEGLADGRAALIQKVHHAVTDGVGGMKMAMMLLDLERDPAPSDDPMPPAPEPEAFGPIELLRDGLAHERRRQVGIAQRSVGQLRDALAQPRGHRAGRGRRCGVAGPDDAAGVRADEPDHDRPVARRPGSTWSARRSAS